LSEAHFSFTAGVLALILGHVVHRLSAKIDEIAAKGAKGIEELSISQRRKGLNECLPQSTVQS
jgi:hypothetical protein